MSRRIPIAIVLAVAVTGCCSSGGGLQGTIPIRGTVTYNGQPLEAGEVRYLPVDASAGRVARGSIDANGRFRLTTLTTEDGALPGEYRIVVVVFQAESGSVWRRELEEQQTGSANEHEPPIPIRFYHPETSGLIDTVNDDHSGYKKLVLVN